MERRTYLGAAAAGGLFALSGCLGAVASRATRTEATPAFLLPSATGGGDTDTDCDDGRVCRPPHLIRALDTEIDSGNPALGTLRVRGWLTGSRLRATDYNSSRSNTEGVAAPDDGTDGEDGEKAQDYNSSRSNRPRTSDGDSDADGLDDGDEETRANNHNTTRSHRRTPVRGEGDGSDETVDLPRAFDYLDDDDDGDGVVVGETFVVTAPVVDFPGLTDPSARASHADYVKNMVTGARAASPTSEETVLRDLTTPTFVSDCCDKATPYIYTSTPADADRPLAGDWPATGLGGETTAPDQSAPVVGRAVATLDGDVRLPVLVWSQRLVHAGDHVFVAGWVVDDARLYGNAATVLAARHRTAVATFGFEPNEAGDAARKETDEPGDVDYSVGTQSDTRPYPPGRTADGDDPCPGPAYCGFDDRSVAEAALARARDARRPDTRPGDDDWMGLFVVRMDGPLGHFAHEDGIEYTDAWEEAVR